MTHKHHYLPEFFLKGFTNDSGIFYVFNSKNEHIKKGEFYPSTHFFELDRNTTHTNRTSDFIEDCYSIKDNRFSKLFRFIQSSSGIPQLDARQMITLQEFVSNIFWRLPVNDKLLENELITNPILKKSFKFISTETGEELNSELTESIRKTDAYIKGSKLQASSLNFVANGFENLHNWRIYYSPIELNIISDSPFILNNESVSDIFKSEFIFPLTKKHLLVRTFGEPLVGNLSSVFGITANILFMKQSKLYCASSSLDLLEAFIPKVLNSELSIYRKLLFRELNYARPANR